MEIIMEKRNFKDRYIKKDEFLSWLNNLTKQEKVKAICDYFGFEHQADVAMEEMGELIQAVDKFKRYNMKRNTIDFETALNDVRKIMNKGKTSDCGCDNCGNCNSCDSCGSYGNCNDKDKNINYITINGFLDGSVDNTNDNNISYQKSTMAREQIVISRQSGKDYVEILKNVHEEIADVLICMDNLMYLFDCHDEVKAIKERKINRSVDRILDEIPDFYFRTSEIEMDFKNVYQYLSLEIFDDLNNSTSYVSKYLNNKYSNIEDITNFKYIFIDRSEKVKDGFVQINTNLGNISYNRFDGSCSLSGYFEKYYKEFKEALNQPSKKQCLKYLDIFHEKIKRDIKNIVKEGIDNNTLDIYIIYNDIKTILF